MDDKSNTFPETEPVGRLMGKYAMSCVISLLVVEAAVGAALLIVELFPRQLIGIFGAASESVYYTQYAVNSASGFTSA